MYQCANMPICHLNNFTIPQLEVVNWGDVNGEVMMRKYAYLHIAISLY